MDVSGIAKLIIFAGLAIAGAGVLLLLLGKIGLPFGELPGDVKVEGKRLSVWFPVVTCIVLSVIVTIVLNIVLRFFR